MIHYFISVITSDIKYLTLISIILMLANIQITLHSKHSQINLTPSLFGPQSSLPVCQWHRITCAWFPSQILSQKAKLIPKIPQEHDTLYNQSLRLCISLDPAISFSGICAEEINGKAMIFA